MITKYKVTLPRPMNFVEPCGLALPGADGKIVRYTMRLHWCLRGSDWRATITNAATGVTVVTARRLSPGAELVELPEGVLMVYGPDPYGFNSLGDTLRMDFIPASQVEAFRNTDTFTDPAFTPATP